MNSLRDLPFSDYLFRVFCLTELQYGDVCVEDGPSDQCLTGNAVCGDTKCSCNADHFHNEHSDTCLMCKFLNSLLIPCLVLVYSRKTGICSKTTEKMGGIASKQIN